MDSKKKLLYKMLVKYYLSDNINASFENFCLRPQKRLDGPGYNHYSGP